MEHSTVSKAIVLPEVSGLEIKEIGEKELQCIFQRHLSWIKGYISFMVQAYQEQVTVLYRFRKNGMALKSQLSAVKKYVQLISFDQLNEKAAKSTIIMLQPYLNKEQDMAKFVIGKVLSLTSRVEYFKLCFDAKTKHLQFQLIYPNLYKNIELNLKTSTYRKKQQTDRKIIVYFQDEEEQTDISQTKETHLEQTKADENLEETCDKIDNTQTVKQPPQIGQKEENKRQETQCKEENKLAQTTFNMFSIQINPMQTTKPTTAPSKHISIAIK